VEPATPAFPGTDELIERVDALARRCEEAARRRPAQRLLAATRRGVRLVAFRGRLVVGRGARCGLVLPSPHVSRAHAAVAVRGGELVVEDLGSTNGTFAADGAIELRAVAPGEEIWFGDEPVRFWPADGSC
jgi:pSer/pThr/pTyr-binding forkhead associated (FHA) protein